MKHITILFLIFVVCSCKKNSIKNENTKNNIENTLKKKHDSLDKPTSIIPNIKNAPKIEGHYILIEGHIAFTDGDLKSLYKGVLNIKKIADNDYDLVRVDKYLKSTPVSEHKMLRYFDDNFYNLSKCNEKYPAYYLCNTYNIQKKGDTLTIKDSHSNANIYTKWKKTNPKDSIHLSLRRTFRNAKNKSKNDYTDFIEETTTSMVDVNIKYKDNGEWYIQHYHKNEDASFYANIKCSD